MMFLNSPPVTAPREEWETWHRYLLTLPSRDKTVLFARRRSAAMLEAIQTANAEAASQASTGQLNG